MAQKKTDILNGSITKTIFSFCIPLVIGSMLQVFFNMADQIVLGQLAGGTALASVGACGHVIGLIINFFVGLSTGVGVVLAPSIGKSTNEESKKIISTAFISSVIIGIVAFLIAIPCGKPLLYLTKCPEECFEGALTYTMICYTGIPVITVYNFCATAIRVTGDSRRPTLYMIIAGALNLILNVILCFTLKNKVAAVAIATVVSQTLGAFLVVRHLVHLNESYRLELKHMHFDRRIFRKFIRYGVPSGLCSCLYNLANLQLQVGINSFGTDAIAGHTAACGVESLISPFVGGFGMTVATMVGQNVGAGNKERVRKSIFYNALYSVSFAAVLCMIVYCLRIPLLRLYVPDSPGAIPFAETRMKCVLLWFSVHACSTVLANTLTSFGYANFVMVSNIISTIIFRTFWMQFIYPMFNTFEIINVCYTVSWWLVLICNTAAFIYVYRKYRAGKTKTI